MGSIILWLVGKGVSQRFARPLAYAGLILLLIAAFFGGKALYDRSVISRHEAKQEAATAKADRKADNKAADERLADKDRSTKESAEIKEAINEARSKGADPRAAYYACVVLQQAARREHKPSPDC